MVTVSVRCQSQRFTLGDVLLPTTIKQLSNKEYDISVVLCEELFFVIALISIIVVQISESDEFI